MSYFLFVAEPEKRKIPLKRSVHFYILLPEVVVRAGSLHILYQQENQQTENVLLLRSDKMATPSCAASKCKNVLFYLIGEIKMTITEIMNNKSLKRLEKRNSLAEAIINREFNVSIILEACESFPEKNISLLLEAIEEVSRSKEFTLEADYLDLAEKYILSSDNSCKREASRIVGNLANKFPTKLDKAITALFQNTKNDGTVIRWASAYALSRIIIIPQYAKSPLFEQISDLCAKENESGVKNQYIKALKKSRKN